MGMLRDEGTSLTKMTLVMCDRWFPMQSCSGCNLSLVTVQRNIVGVCFARKVILSEGDTRIVVRLQLLELVMMMTVQLWRETAVVAFLEVIPLTGYISSKMTAADVTDFAVMEKLPLLVVMDLCGTVWWWMPLVCTLFTWHVIRIKGSKCSTVCGETRSRWRAPTAVVNFCYDYIIDTTKWSIPYFVYISIIQVVELIITLD